MKATADCLICLLRQALNTARALSKDENFHIHSVKKATSYVMNAPLEETPAAISKPIYKIIAKYAKIHDPFFAQKELSNNIAMQMAPTLRKIIKRSKDPLATALNIAVAGNTIDFGIATHNFNIAKEINKLIKQNFSINVIDKFKNELKHIKNLLYICDNAGEIVFDMLLIEELLKNGLNIKAAVKSGPIINDATMEDAEKIGLTKIVQVITTGSDDIGINWKNVSKNFLKSLKEADCIIAKGQGNFETCDNRKENFYFLLKAKCYVIADALGVKLNDIVFTHISLLKSMNKKEL